MPKMTRPGFAAMTERLWGHARANFERDQNLASVLLGYDPMGRQVLEMLAGSPEAVETPESQELADAVGTILVPGRFTENLNLLADHIRTRNVVAAVTFNEAWYATGDLAQYLAEKAMLPSEHPLSIEVAEVLGLWPREHFEVQYLGIIERPESARAHITRTVVNTAPAQQASWLREVLPRPH